MLQACLNGVRPAGAHPGLPISPRQVARDARAVAERGVWSVHVHPRCGRGQETIDPEPVGTVVAAIRSRTPGVEVVVPSARWVDPDPRRRIEAMTGWGRLGWAKPDVVAVSVGETGWLELCAAALRQGIGVELGLWSAADAVGLRRAGIPPGVVRVCAEVTLPDPKVGLAEAQRILRALGPVAVPVLLHGEDTSAWPLWRHATEHGLDGRIGLEDTLTRPDGTPALDNPDLIDHALRTRPLPHPGPTAARPHERHGASHGASPHPSGRSR